ncbi:threonine ammonia-lyase [Dongia sedimenti]|uniref:Threonine/serine dehydratase n=1 Tax=Dongia sedimenti TaxID=3064282 RepID=A0ABU0YSF1_9PROT|nr:threonine/serine dehydratase [Rhodospirillaceae bacterium R-7]
MSPPEPAQRSVSCELAPDFADVEQAEARLAQVVRRLPLFESASLNRQVGGRVMIKAESLQPTGSFKIRGAWNKLCRLSSEDGRRGVLALSSGNHGIAVAWASGRIGSHKTIVLMPAGSARNKVARIEALGGEVVLFDRATTDRPALIREWCAREDLAYIPAFDDPHVIAGAGTIGLEVARCAADQGFQIDGFYAACSGGGLIAGNAIALGVVSPQTRVWGVEPESFDDTARSLESGKAEFVSFAAPTICDALLSPTPGRLTLEINRKRLAGVLRGSDEDARRGMQVAYEEFGLIVEPSGALALGAVLADRSRTEGQFVVVVLSGRNVDLDVYQAELAKSVDGRGVA